MKIHLFKVGVTMALCLFAGATSGAATITSGLVAEYTFDSGNANNSGPLGTDGADVGNPIYSTVAGRQALTVSEGNYVEVAADPDVYSGDEARTVALWLNVDSYAVNASPFRSGSTESLQDFSIELDPNDEWRLNTWGNDISGNEAGSTGEWHHIALTYDGDGTFISYIDGVVSQTVSSTFTTSEGILRFGGPRIGKPGGQGADFSVDDILIYNRALTGAEIMAISSIPEPSTAILPLIVTAFVFLRRRR